MGGILFGGRFLKKFLSLSISASLRYLLSVVLIANTEWTQKCGDEREEEKTGRQTTNYKERKKRGRGEERRGQRRSKEDGELIDARAIRCIRLRYRPCLLCYSFIRLFIYLFIHSLMILLPISVCR